MAKNLTDLKLLQPDKPKSVQKPRAVASPPATKKQKKTAKKTLKSDVTKKKTAAERTAAAFSAIGPLVGLGSTVASAIPSLKKPQRSNVRVSSLPIAQAAMGVASQGYGVNRGGATMQGLRAAGQSGQYVASQQLAAQSQNEINNINQTNARNERIAGFGADMASGVADLGVGLLDVANARKAERMGLPAPSQQAAKQTTGQAQPAWTPKGRAGSLDAQGGQKALPQDPSAPFEAPPLAELLTNPETQEAAIMQSLQAEMDGITGAQIRNRTEAFNQARALNGMPPLDGYASIAPDLEFRHKMINFGIDEIHKRGGNLLNSLVPLSRALGTDLTQLMNPPTSFGIDDEDPNA